MKFIIKWRRTNYGRGRSISSTVTGISKYATRSLAEKQKAIWQSLFPFNTYYIEGNNS